jgi:hypothetical protein
MEAKHQDHMGFGNGMERQRTEGLGLVTYNFLTGDRHITTSTPEELHLLSDVTVPANTNSVNDLDNLVGLGLRKVDLGRLGILDSARRMPAHATSH